MDEPRFTLDEAARELARRECSLHGHSWDVIGQLGGQPLRILCHRCGRSNAVLPDRANADSDALLAQLTAVLAPLMDPEKCSAFTSAWEIDAYNLDLDGEAIWHELKAIYDAVTQRDQASGSDV